MATNSFNHSSSFQDTESSNPTRQGLLKAQDELANVRRILLCFSQLFLLIAGQEEPLDSQVLGTIATFLEDLQKRIQIVEKELQDLDS